MRPVEGQDQLWYCSKHGMYAQLVERDVADAAGRGSAHALPNGLSGVVMGTGDERQGGTVLYLREA
mgnify:CR=1 FL=1